MFNIHETLINTPWRIACNGCSSVSYKGIFDGIIEELRDPLLYNFIELVDDEASDA